MLYCILFRCAFVDVAICNVVLKVDVGFSGTVRIKPKKHVAFCNAKTVLFGRKIWVSAGYFENI